MPLDLEQLIHEAAGRIDEAGSLEQLDAVRVDFLGKKGKLTGVLKSIGRLNVSAHCLHSLGLLPLPARKSKMITTTSKP